MRVRNKKFENASLAYFDGWGKRHQLEISEWLLDVPVDHLKLITKELGHLECLPEAPAEEPSGSSEPVEVQEEAKVEPKEAFKKNINKRS